MSYTQNEKIISRNVEDEMKDSYLRYSMSVIIARALPDVRDGLKPSQRRILFAMRQLSLSPTGKHRKCAKISGDTSGDYHPHGEQVIYPTLVRMAQEWAMRYRLVDGQGNFGSIDGDPPAAMRYTEARLTHASAQLMEDLDKETVDMVPNYDETKKEPTVFPAKFPNLLCNGSSGIAVGMATNIPSHNLNELINATIMVLDDPKTTIQQIQTVMPGPDFATGGIICGVRGIKEAYHTGRGKLTLRGLLTVEDDTKNPDRQRIVVTEIPYNVKKSRLIEQIAELINNKAITGISDLRDESDKDGLRIVFELKRNEIPEVIVNQLYKFSDLQVTFGCNMLALDKGLPRTMNIKHFMDAWIEHRMEVVRRRTRFELKKAEARVHVLEGYLKALDHMDEVVKTIRSSNNRDEAKEELVRKFEFTVRQATAVLELRLYQLTGLERDKIQAEYEDLLKKIEYYLSVLANEYMVRNIIKDELKEIQSAHKSERRTQILPAEDEMNMEDLIADEPMIITISDDDYIKRMPMSTFREQRRGGMGVSGVQLRKEEDIPKAIYVADTHDYILLFTNLGRCYWLKVWQIPESGRKSKGKPLINLLEDLRENEKVATVVKTRTFEGESCVLMVTRNGTIKKTPITNFSNPRRNGIWAIEIQEGDELVDARVVAKNDQIMLFTRNGMAVRFDESKSRPMGRMARGVRGITLRGEGDLVVGCEIVKGTETILTVCELGFGKRSAVEDFRQTNRGGVGVRAIIVNERNGKVVRALCVSDDDGLLMLSASGQAVRITMKELRVMGRNTQGVKLVNLKEEDYLVAIQKVSAEDRAEGDIPTQPIAGIPEEMPEELVDESIVEEVIEEEVSEDEGEE
jgi:DNA gyrase subunit A